MLTVMLVCGGLGFIIGVATMGIVNYIQLRQWRKTHG